MTTDEHTADIGELAAKTWRELEGCAAMTGERKISMVSLPIAKVRALVADRRALTALEARCAELGRERDRCHARLEIDHHYVMPADKPCDTVDDLVRVEIPLEDRLNEVDGIEARDATIAGLEQQLQALRDRIEREPVVDEARAFAEWAVDGPGNCYERERLEAAKAGWIARSALASAPERESKTPGSAERQAVQKTPSRGNAPVVTDEIVKAYETAFRKASNGIAWFQVGSNYDDAVRYGLEAALASREAT